MAELNEDELLAVFDNSKPKSIEDVEDVAVGMTGEATVGLKNRDIVNRVFSQTQEN